MSPAKAKKRTKAVPPRKASAPKSAHPMPQAKAPGRSERDPLVAPGSPDKYRVRVRMYRHGLGDCFLITFPREGKDSFQVPIDCGALGRNAQFMRGIVEHIRDTVLSDQAGAAGKARLDVVVGTHEHKDHLSGFNQARPLFNEEFDFGSVWLSWTENLSDAAIRKIKETRKRAIAGLEAALASPLAAAEALAGVAEILSFSQDDDSTGQRSVSEAIDYLKQRGRKARDLQYLEPGGKPFGLDGVDGVRVFVLGPPRDPLALKESEVTEEMIREGVVYHLSRTGEVGMDALMAAFPSSPGTNGDRFHPFAPEHRIRYCGRDSLCQAVLYDKAGEAWRRIDHDWQNAFGQLALDLDNDTNNTSLVLAFEFEKTGEVLLFPADAQVGSWKSWAKVTFDVPDRAKPLPAHDLLSRTVFYKVAHHCSHNATLRQGGLEIMGRDDLVAFIPLDEATAKKQGKKGWEMPAPPLYEALTRKAAGRVVISDVTEPLPPAAQKAGVVATNTFVDFFLR
jgi:hypothetical protein